MCKRSIAVYILTIIQSFFVCGSILESIRTRVDIICQRGPRERFLNKRKDQGQIQEFSEEIKSAMAGFNVCYYASCLIRSANGVSVPRAYRASRTS